MSTESTAVRRGNEPIAPNGSKHPESEVNKKSVRKVSEEKTAKKTAIGKGDTRYWLQKGKLYADSRTRGAFCCKIQVNGRRESFPLRTANREAAATKAARIYLDVAALGWDTAIAKHKPEEKRTKGALTGDLIREATALADVRPATLRSNLNAFRRIVASVAKIDATKGRYARCGTGRSAWIAAIDAVPLAKITPAAVEGWKLAFVASHSAKDETKARAARNSANATLRSAKSLFSKRLLRFLAEKIELPSPLPFDGVKFFPRQSMRYVSTIDVQKIIAQAGAQLATFDSEAFKAFILCLFAGLRRNEADKLRWSSVDLEAGMIRIEAHEDFAPKAETSLAEIPLEPEAVSILRGMRAKASKAEYVLDGVPPKINASWRAYRAEETFGRLGAWLKTQGITSRSPLHTLRKEAGSLICQKSGLFAASRFLRHADVAITAQHYAAQKDRVTVGLGSLLAVPANNVVKADFKPQEVKAVKMHNRRRTA